MKWSGFGLRQRSRSARQAEQVRKSEEARRFERLRLTRTYGYRLCNLDASDKGIMHPVDGRPYCNLAAGASRRRESAACS
jgi:hypothetical protein